MSEAGDVSGRPSGYREEYARIAQKACELGATDLDIAEAIDVDVRTIYRWKHQFPDFCQALKRGKEQADELVEASLFRRATGYSHPATKIMAVDGAVAQVDYTEHYAPDTTAAIFWLKNRQPEKWRDRREVTGADGGPLTVQVVRFSDADDQAPA